LALPSRVTYETRHLQSAPAIGGAILFFAMLGAGVFQAWRQGTRWRTVALGCVAILGFNLLMHSQFYLHDMFLFALHWQGAMLFLLAALLAPGTRAGTVGVWAVMALAVAAAVTSYDTVKRVERLAVTAQPGGSPTH
jgi:hypothetical protein